MTRIHQIDALRGIAALLVATFHIGVVLGVYRTGPLDGLQPFTWLYDYGWTLVDLFFVISGYIFAHVYLSDDCSLKPGTTAGRFTIARIARLYPLHLASLVVMAAILPFAAGNSPESFVLNLLMLQESGLNDGKSFNQPAWSISVEVFCYAIFYSLARYGLLKRVTPALILLGLGMTAGDNSTADHIGRGFVGFFVGTSLWRARHVEISPMLPVLAVLLALLLPDLHEWVSMGALFSISLWPALIVLALRTNLALDWLGDRSYSIYMWHWPVYSALKLTPGPLPPALHLPVALAALALLIVVSDLSYRHLESPMRRAINRSSAKWLAAS